MGVMIKKELLIKLTGQKTWGPIIFHQNRIILKFSTTESTVSATPLLHYEIQIK